jgi:hypothetical protein
MDYDSLCGSGRPSGLAVAIAVYALTRPSLPSVVLLLVPLAITVVIALWTALASRYSEYGDSWAVLPVLVAGAVVLVWHLGLVVRGPGRGVLIAYAVAHLAFWLPFGVFCLMKISKDSL